MSNSSDDENTELSYCFSNLDRLQKRSSLPFSGRPSVHPVQDLGFRMRDSDRSSSFLEKMGRSSLRAYRV